ncbi:MAG: ornithine cyclodeaminase family protein [Burkholderiales bacterium]
MSDAVWLTEQDVVQLMDLKDAIGALEAALREEAAGAAQNMTKTLMQFDGHSNLHAIGGKVGDIVGTKTWAHTGGGTSPLLTLWSANDGQPVAIIEAFALGNMRTGGISGLAADWMARSDVKVMGIAGGGKQALSQVGAILAVRPIERVQVFSPRPESRAEFAVRVRAEFGVEVIECASAEAVCKGAGIVTLVTRAAKPFVTASMLERGTHLNAVGAIARDREEFSQDVFERTNELTNELTSAIAVDMVASVQQLSCEFRTRFGEPGPRWDAVPPLSKLIASGRRRGAADDLSIFKSMGMGISDLALGVELVRRARTQGIGRTIPQPKKAKPRMTRCA